MRRQVLLATALAVAIVASPVDGSATTDGRIVFRSWDRGTEGLYVMDTDGSGVQPIKNTVHTVALRSGYSAQGDSDPQWSPDGELLVFWSNRTGNADVWVIKPDGSGLKNLTNNRSAGERDPAWSPTGERIVYSNGDLFTMTSSGKDRKRILRTDQVVEGSADWGANGLIAYARGVSGPNQEIWVVRPDGAGNVRLLGGDTFVYSDPAWSPDGTQLAFLRGPEDALYGDIYRAAFDPATLTLGPLLQVTSTRSTAETEPRWSPDGTRLVVTAFECFDEDGSCNDGDGVGERRLETVGLDGSNRAVVTRGGSASPDWTS